MAGSDQKLKIPYVLIPRSALNFTTPSVFDIYVPVANRYVKVIKSGELVDPERIERYLEKKSDILYIESQSIEIFLDERFAAIFDGLRSHLDAEVRLRELVRCLELCLLDLRLVRFHIDKFMRLQVVIGSLFEIFKNREIRSVLLKVSNEHLESLVTRRAILGSFLAIAMLFEQGDTTPAMFSSLMLGALCRDLDCLAIEGEDPHSNSQNLTAENLQKFREHPSNIIKRLRDCNVLDDVIENIIGQHHENPTGNGFPLGLKRLETYLPAQFLWIGDWLVTNIEDYRVQKVPIEYLIESIKTSFPPEQKKALPILLRVLGQCFAIKNLSLAK